MSKKSLVKVVGVVLSLLILLTALPLGVSAADTAAVTPEAGNVTEKITETTRGQRVPAEEGDSLYTIVTDNGDGTHTMTLYDHPVKFVDSTGKLQDISLEIAAATDGSYKTKANDIQTAFPSKISDGITLSGKGVSVKLTPDRGKHSSPTAPTIGTIIADATVTKLDNETVSYYYDNKTTLEYSLTYTGFKEDIVVSEYTGQTEYHFLLETGGLRLTKIDESYYLTDGNGEIKATLGDIIIFTADERNNALGSMTHETVKENEQYIITIHVDAEYLKDEKTKYPIRIDPTIEITYDSNGSGAIQDVTLNELSGSSGSSGSIYVGKRNTYGISRTLIKFPGLNLGSIPSAGNLISAHVEIRDMLCETTSMMVYGCIFAGNDWTESTANWSNTTPNYYTEMPHAYAEVSYSNGNSKNPKHRYSIDITQAVKSWKTGFYDQAKGIMLKASDEVEYGSALYKTFASYNRASHKPSLKVNYQAQEIFLSYDTDRGANMAVGQTRQIIVQSEYTPTATYWSSSNGDIASVSNSGLVTGKKPGTVDITATYTFSGGVTSTKKLRFYVKNSIGIVDNENYYIMNYASKKFLSLESATDANDTNIYLRNRTSEAVSKWQLSAQGNKEYYLVNNYSSFGRILTRISTNASLWVPIAPLPQYFTILRVDEEPYEGLYLICIGDYYLTQDSSGTNAYFTTYTTSYSYWSLFKSEPNNVSITSFEYNMADGEYISSNDNEGVYNTFYSSLGYSNVSILNNPNVSDSFNQLKSNDVYFYFGHGKPGALLFNRDNDFTYGVISANNTINNYSTYEEKYFIRGNSIDGNDDIDDNIDLSNLSCVFYFGCETGVTTTGGYYQDNLLNATYDRGAHFVAGSTRKLNNGSVETFVPFLLSYLSSGKSLAEAIDLAQIATGDVYLDLETMEVGSFPITYVGDATQYLIY